MAYEAMLRARPVFGQSISEKHDAWTRTLARLEGGWGLAGKVIPPAPDPGTGLLAEARLTGLFGKRVKGRAVYRLREQADDAGMYDDYLVLEFTPSRVDYPGLVALFDRYVDAFGAYRGHVGPIPESLEDLESDRRTDLRRGIWKILPVMFLDDELSRRALSMSTREVADRVRPVAHEVRLVSGGVLFVAGREPMTQEDASRYDAAIRDALSRSPPAAP